MKYLVIDKRSFVGNDVMFWNKNSSGYTTCIDSAQKYTEKEAMNLDSGRSTDIAILFTDVESKCRRVVDFQNLDRDIFHEGYSCFNKNNSESDSERVIGILNNKMSRLETLFDNCEYWVDEYNAPFEEAIKQMRKDAKEIIESKVAQ